MGDPAGERAAETATSPPWISREGAPGLVSIVVPAFNRAGLIAETLQSVFAQDYRPIEIVVVDDGSTDETAAAAEALAARAPEGVELRVLRKPNGGVSSARNAGLRACRGGLIALLDSDDLLEPGAISRAADALRQSGADAAYGDWLPFRAGADGQRIFGKRRKLAPMGDPVAFYLTIGNWLPNHCYLFKRWAVAAAGPFDEAISLQEDVEFLINVALAGARFAAAPGRAALYREHRRARGSDGGVPALLHGGERMLPRARARLEAAGEFTPERREAWACHLWRLSAEIVLLDRERYEHNVAQARSVWPRMAPPRRIYRALIRTLGLRRADIVMAWARASKRGLRRLSGG